MRGNKITQLSPKMSPVYHITPASSLSPPLFTIPNWTSFLALGFSSKTPPPSSSYFLAHYNEDVFKGSEPEGDIYLCLKLEGEDRQSEVARVSKKGVKYINTLPSSSSLSPNDAKFASTLRLFNRLINGLPLRGLGEVTTHPEEGGLGLSTDLINHMLGKLSETECVVLHAAGKFKGYYERLGWRNCKGIPYFNVVCGGEKEETEMEGREFGGLPEVFNDDYKGMYEGAGLGGVERNVEYFNSWFKWECNRWGTEEGSGYGEVRVGGVLKGWVVLRVDGEGGDVGFVVL